jgi:galactose oxidase
MLSARYRLPGPHAIAEPRAAKPAPESEPTFRAAVRAAARIATAMRTWKISPAVLAGLLASTFVTGAVATPRVDADSARPASPGGGPPDPAQVGAWTAPFPFPTIPIHAHLLPTGLVFFWDRHDVPDGDGHPRLWDPATGTFSAAPDPPPGHDLFCSGHAFLEDGRLFVAGGHYSDGQGQPFAALYDPFVSTWTLLPEMNAGRWYPTATTLADGRVLVVAGSDELGASNVLPQVYGPADFGWQDLTGALRDLPYYPLVFQAPDGKAFVAAPEAVAKRLDPAWPGAWSSVGSSGHGFRTYGSAVAYGVGKILLAGGGEPPTATAQVIDLTSPNPAFREVPPMAAARRQLNLTLLPDGTVLATGGTSADGFNNATGAVLATELWSPSAESWSALAPMAVPRLYHSVALLLPDARILVAGGGHPSDTAHGDPDHLDGQVFSPPYLFRGPRPTIVAAPETVALGSSFQVTVGPEAGVESVTWVRLGSVTHGFNMNQSFVRIASKAVANGRAAVAPGDSRHAPPGHYLMFALSAEGVPSLGRMIRLSGGLFSDGFESGSTAAWSEVQG